MPVVSPWRPSREPGSLARRTSRRSGAACSSGSGPSSRSKGADLSQFPQPDPEQLRIMDAVEARITTVVDVSPFVERKRTALTTHASQIEESLWGRLPPRRSARSSVRRPSSERTTPPARRSRGRPVRRVARTTGPLRERRYPESAISMSRRFGQAPPDGEPTRDRRVGRAIVTLPRRKPVLRPTRGKNDRSPAIAESRGEPQRRSAPDVAGGVHAGRQHHRLLGLVAPPGDRAGLPRPALLPEARTHPRRGLLRHDVLRRPPGHARASTAARSPRPSGSGRVR